jgi:hypothetical protein
MGGTSPQNPKKKPNFGGDTHVTLNPKPTIASHPMHFREFSKTLSNFMDFSVQTFKFCHKIGKVNQELESQTPISSKW